MKTLLHISILFAAFTVIGCNKDNSADYIQLPESCDYFPLKLGNSWEYNNTRLEVKQVVLFNNREYFEIESNQYQADTIYYTYQEYYRKTSDGKIFKYNPETKKEILKYNMNIPEKGFWTYSEDNYGHYWKVIKITNSKTINIHNRKIDDCMQFDFDLIQAVDDEHTIILAPGIGRLISNSYAWGLGDTLKRATINGVDYIIK